MNSEDAMWGHMFPGMRSSMPDPVYLCQSSSRESQKNTYDPRQCGVCNEDFDEDLRCPRTLRCSHHLCSTCIDSLIINRSRKCPFCRRHFKANNASDIMINQGILDFITYLAHPDVAQDAKPTIPEAPAAKSTDILSSKSRIGDYKEEVAKATSDLLIICQDEKVQLENTVRDVQRLKEMLKLDNIQINEEILPRVRSIAKRNFRKIEELHLEEKKLKDQLMEVHLKEKHLHDMKVTLEAATSFKEMVTLMDRSEDTNAAIGTWAEHSKTRVCENRKDIQNFEEEMQAAREQVQLLSDSLRYNNTGDDDEDGDPFPTCVIQ